MANNPPRRVDIKGQDHMLAYITPEEGGILQLLGGSGAPGPMGIPSYFAGSSMGGIGEDAQAAAENSMGIGPHGGPGGGASTQDTAGNQSTSGDAPGGSMTTIGPDGNIESYYGPDQVPALSKMGKLYGDIFGIQNKVNAQIEKDDRQGIMSRTTTDKYGNITGITASGVPSIGYTDIMGLLSLNPISIGKIGLSLAGKNVSTYTGIGTDPNSTDDSSYSGSDNDVPFQQQPYRLPTNPYNRNEYKGTELPINTTIPNSPITTDPTVQDPNAERDYNLSQGLNEGYDFAKSPFAGMSINDTQLLTAPKEFSGISSLQPLDAQNVYSNVTNDNMVKSYQDSAKGLGSVGADLRANKGYGM